ncbi:MAG: Mut7-C ubiquitin/RNAse domain-containing protein [Candidatus Competibacteraceae bacterium]|nr:MAG: Mut7-C ubiquitin/RNAse domain-containing protein [Candidatus Competibacteraceae bacterium]
MRFYEELNDFLPPARRKVRFIHEFQRRASIKDMIEALGVPHTEIDLILVNGQSVDFSHIVRDGDHISVYPLFETFDIQPLIRVHPRPLRVSRFVLDVHLGKLARYLRLLGFDTLYRNDYEDAELARLASAERRILLTRDRDLLKRAVVTHGYYVRAVEPRRQVEEVVDRLDLYRTIRPLQRCARCNGLLAVVPKQQVWERLLPETRRYIEAFWECGECGQLYWEGSHVPHIRRFIDNLQARAGNEMPETGPIAEPGP